MKFDYHGYVPTPKTLKEFLFHITMIFIGVSLAFWADHQLEKRIENEHGEQYVNNFIADVEKDTMYIKRVIDRDKYSLSIMDSLLALRNEKISNSHIKELFYEYSYVFQSAEMYFQSSDPTLMQLKKFRGFSFDKQSKSSR